jgi:hypothetical protein
LQVIFIVAREKRRSIAALRRLMSGQHLDLSSDPHPPEKDPPRRFLGVHFACCAVYARVYLNRDGTEYVGHCPRCLRAARFVISEDGHSGRFFSVS